MAPSKSKSAPGAGSPPGREARFSALGLTESRLASLFHLPGFQPRSENCERCEPHKQSDHKPKLVRANENS